MNLNALLHLKSHNCIKKKKEKATDLLRSNAISRYCLTNSMKESLKIAEYCVEEKLLNINSNISGIIYTEL